MVDYNQQIYKRGSKQKLNDSCKIRTCFLTPFAKLDDLKSATSFKTSFIYKLLNASSSTTEKSTNCEFSKTEEISRISRIEPEISLEETISDKNYGASERPFEENEKYEEELTKPESLKDSFLSLRMVVYLLFYVFLTPRIVSFQNWIYPWLKWSFRFAYTLCHV